MFGDQAKGINMLAHVTSSNGIQAAIETCSRTRSLSRNKDSGHAYSLHSEVLQPGGLSQQPYIASIAVTA